MTEESIIHLRVPAATKGRWVRASRAEGLRLTDWIVRAVEAQMQQSTTVAIAIPAGLDFADLKLSRESDGSVAFDWAAIQRICDASRLDARLFRDAPEDNVAGLIVAWYSQARAAGEPVDLVAEDLIAEAAAEARIGQAVSLAPGRA